MYWNVGMLLFVDDRCTLCCLHKRRNSGELNGIWPICYRGDFQSRHERSVFRRRRLVIPKFHCIQDRSTLECSHVASSIAKNGRYQYNDNSEIWG
jgi:hypothetical protein